MLLKKRLLSGSKLYVILDAQVNGYDELFEMAKRCITLGVDIVQLRDKLGKPKEMMGFAKRIMKIRRRKTLLIINDRVDVAKAVNADGVHLGQDDIPVATARRILGAKRVIGKSCQSYEQILKARDEGSDYIGFGSVFKTLTKPERQPMDWNLLARVAKFKDVPIFFIGGITLQNMNRLEPLGVRRVAVCREICLAKDINGTIKDFQRALQDKH